MKGARKPKTTLTLFGPDDGRLSEERLKKIIDKKRERKAEKKRKREARRLKHGKTKVSKKGTKED